MTPPKPRPVPDDLSAGYWQAAAAGELAIQRCQDCGHYAHPPTTVCGSCFTVPASLEYEPVSGHGAIVTWTVFRQSFLPGFSDDVPYTIAVVELDEQADLAVIGRLTNGPDVPITVGDRVQVTFDTLDTGEAIPAFTLESSAT